MMITVFIIDGSATVRTALKSLFNEHVDIQVLGTASTPQIAFKKMTLHGWPDVIVSDFFLPEKAGIGFFKQVKRLAPTPFVFLSDNQKASQSASIEALRLGAAEIILKAGSGIHASRVSDADIIKHIIRAAESAQRVFDEKRPRHHKTIKKNTAEHTMNQPFNLIAIGSSTGGTSIIEKLLKTLPDNCAPVLIVQHMPYPFTQTFAERLDALCDIKVKQAEDGERIQQGFAYIAQGGKHLVLKKDKEGYRLTVNAAPLINHHRPSIDTLFSSIAETGLANVVGILLTGMGKDGAKGLLALKQQGNYTVAQHPSDCTVYGMPKAAIAMNATHDVLDLNEIIDRIFCRL